MIKMETMKINPAFSPLILPAGFVPNGLVKDYARLGMFPGVSGRERGIAAAGDIVTRTADGRDLNTLWNEFQETMNLHNERRSALVRFLTYGVTVENEEVFQGGTGAEFEPSTEFGEPVGYRPTVAGYTMGYSFGWWDLASRFTWRYLAEAPASQVEMFNNAAIEADNRRVFSEVMATLFNNTRRTNKAGNVVYPFYNGESIDAADTPPKFGATVHAAGHNHYLTTGAAALEPEDVEAMEDHLAHHGYRKANGYRLILMVNKAQADLMRQWRASANGGQGRYDFVPAQGTSPFLLPTDMRTVDALRPPSQIDGFNVVGQYGEFVVIEEDYVPAGYLVGFATGGDEALPNPVAFREHANAGLRGMRLVKGRTPDYPLIDSFYSRGFGTGVRHRGAAVLMQVTANAAYTPPAQYAFGMPTAAA